MSAAGSGAKISIRRSESTGSAASGGPRRPPPEAAGFARPASASAVVAHYGATEQPGAGP